MSTTEEADQVDLSGSDTEFPSQAEGAEQEHYKTPDRRHVDALLAISEEHFLKELEPYENHSSSEAIRGWARVDPISCILLAQKSYRKQKRKDDDNLAPLSGDPVILDVNCFVEHHCESTETQQKNARKSMSLHRHLGSRSKTDVAAPQKDTSDFFILREIQKTTPNIFQGETTEKEMTLRQILLQSRPSVLQKHNQKVNNSAVPLRSFTFLPPINSPHLHHPSVSCQVCSFTRIDEGEPRAENDFKRRTGADPVASSELSPDSAGLISKCWPGLQKPHLFSAIAVSNPNRYQVPLSSKHDTRLHTSFSMGKRLSTVAGAPARMRPTRTGCAIKLSEGWN